MQKLYLFLLLLLFIPFIGCSDSVNVADTLDLLFVDDEILMKDMERETRFVDSALCVARTISTRSMDSQKKLKALSFNSKEQLIKFLKYLNTAIESNGKWLLVFYDKISNKIVDLTLAKTDRKIYIGLKEKEFRDKLKAGEIDFKLIETKDRITSTPLVSKTVSNTEYSDGLVPADTMFSKYFHGATGSDYVLGGITRLVHSYYGIQKAHIRVSF